MTDLGEPICLSTAKTFDFAERVEKIGAELPGAVVEADMLDRRSYKQNIRRTP